VTAGGRWNSPKGHVSVGMGGGGEQLTVKTPFLCLINCGSCFKDIIGGEHRKRTQLIKILQNIIHYSKRVSEGGR
jgi:hypothetical protein